VTDATPRVLHCISSLEGGGAERQLTVIASEQARRGYSVHVAYLRGGIYQNVLEQNGVTLHHLAHSGNLDPTLLLRTFRLIRRARPDIVQTWLTQMDVVAGAAARMAGVAWIISERSSALAYPPGWRQRTRVRLARGASLIVANSNGGLNYWEQAAIPVPRRVIGNAVAVNEIRSAHPSPVPDKAVLFVGRLAEEKRVPALLHGYAAATAVGPLLICGEGYQRDALESMATRLGLSNRVQFLGFRDDVWSLMRGAACVVNPSAFEGCPNAVIEAMAAERPVVVSDIPAHREFLTERDAAFVNPEDPQALAAALMEAVTGSAGVRERVARARARVALLGIDSICDAYAAAYRDVLSNRRRH